MSANSVLLDFSLDPTRINDEVSRKDIVKLCKEHLEKFISGLKITYDMLTDDGYLCILNAPGAIITTIRFFNQGLITINIEYYRAESEAPKITFEVRRPFLLGGGGAQSFEPKMDAANFNVYFCVTLLE